LSSVNSGNSSWIACCAMDVSANTPFMHEPSMCPGQGKNQAWIHAMNEGGICWTIVQAFPKHGRQHQIWT
jgi:hypothetical protein